MFMSTQELKQGFKYASTEDEALGIQTNEEAGICKAKLSTGQEVVVRKLKGRDFIRTKKTVQMMGSDADFETINMSVATTIDGNEQPMEFYLDLFQSDYSLVTIMHAKLNFQ